MINKANLAYQYIRKLFAEELKDKEWKDGELEQNILDAGIISETQLLKVYRKVCGFQIVNSASLENLTEKLPVKFTFLFTYKHLPYIKDDRLFLAISSVENLETLVSYYQILFPNNNCTFVFARRTIIERNINRLYYEEKEKDKHFVEDEKSLKNLAEEAPIIRFVNDIFSRALEEDVSDIHLELEEDNAVVRYRIDGELQTFFSPPSSQYAAIATRLKLIGGLNISERRLPQDGRITTSFSNIEIDLRMSTLPSIHGESVVMRILKKDQSLFDLNKLGMLEDMQKKCIDIINNPYGMLLVVGPTGSGKSTTLYSLISLLNSGKKKIITVEDPIEYTISNITQMQVNADIGLTFAKGLRSIVRQDPDIILIGEIRDHETAEMAVQASLTGHFVFSTLHTNTAAGAIARLKNLGVENFLISSALTAVLSQRLVRKVCPKCKGEKRKTVCNKCSDSGYRGRLGLYQFLLVDDKIRDAISKNQDSNAIEKIALQQGTKSLYDDGLEKVSMGYTTEEEVKRVLLSNNLIDG